MKMDREVGDHRKAGTDDHSCDSRSVKIRINGGEREGVMMRDDNDEKTTSSSNKGGDNCLNIDIIKRPAGISRDVEDEINSEAEKVCRICHFGRETSASNNKEILELIPLGCDCKGELGSSHPHCAQAWFTQKGDRLCEICGKMAKNISSNNAEESSISMMEDWNEMRMVAATLDASRESSRCCKQTFCNILLACLVLAFLLPWFFRGIDML